MKQFYIQKITSSYDEDNTVYIVTDTDINDIIKEYLENGGNDRHALLSALDSEGIKYGIGYPENYSEIFDEVPEE